jgi:hypothetical protein
MDAILPLIDNGKLAFEANWTPYHPPCDYLLAERDKHFRKR